MNDPVIPVSWGELFDRISILEIKRTMIRAPEAAANVAREYAALLETVSLPDPPTDGLAELRSALASVNQRLWTIEDRIREMDARGDFGPAFVALARSVYRENDERGRIKRAINVLLGATLIEEKSYARY